MEEELKIDLTNTQKNLIYTFIKKYDPQELMSDTIAANAVFQNLISRLKNNQSKKIGSEDFRTHILKDVIGTNEEDDAVRRFRIRGKISSDLTNEELEDLNDSEKKNKIDTGKIEEFLGSNSLYQLTFLSNPQALKRTIYYELDSQWRNTAGSLETNLTEFQFLFSVSRASNDSNYQNIIAPTNVTAVMIPNAQIPIPNSYNWSNNADFITLDIKEFRAHGIKHPRGNFCMKFNIEKSTNYLNLSPSLPDGKISFPYPLRSSFDVLNVIFKSQFAPIIFDPDRAFVSSVTVGNPTIFNFANNITISNNDLLYISGFSTGTSNIDSLINRDQGQICSVLSNNSLSIPVDTTGLVVNSLPLVIFSSKLIRMTLALEYIIPNDGNSFKRLD